ncbi:hypothetical protein V6N11_030407 [Hibiscus sabdariffa]|uniref:Endonuclease/exonuclease/phosphatase domain-containing protein n=1 Tax=Hibiscus sabdariffa TaxID=183260 RepID=A0ABR2PKT5_9ROSI
MPLSLVGKHRIQQPLRLISRGPTPMSGAMTQFHNRKEKKICGVPSWPYRRFSFFTWQQERGVEFLCNQGEDKGRGLSKGLNPRFFNPFLRSRLRGRSRFLGSVRLFRFQIFSCPASCELSFSCWIIPTLLVVWNVRGLGNKDTNRALRNSIQKVQPDIIFLSETKQKKGFLEKVKTKMKMAHSFYVEPFGIAGGLALWWSNDTHITVLKSGKHFIDAKISIKGEPEWYGSFIYGPPYKEEKREFWEMMTQMGRDSEECWLVVGDTNVVARLIELPISGGSFTWSNQRSEEDAILEKLDRALCSLEWSVRYPKAVGLLDVAIGSDHAPIIIYPHGLTKKHKRDFKFESKWLLEEECKSTVQASWTPCTQPRPSHRFGSKLRRTKYSLIKWSKLKTRIHNNRKQELLEKIKAYQGKQMSKAETADSKACKKELDSMWEGKERYWHQRARVEWLKYGDKNTKFFHAMTLQHRRRNSICRLKKASGEWIEDSNEIASHIQNHFQSIYSKDMTIVPNLLDGAVWRASGFGYSPSPQGFSCFAKWWEEVSVSRKFGLGEDGCSLMAFLLWAIWKSRNKLVFDGTPDTPVDVWKRAEEACEEFLGTKTRLRENVSSLPNSVTNQSVQNRWSPPPMGSFKICCDAAFDKLTGEAAAAAIIRDCTGAIVAVTDTSFVA